MKHKYFKFLPSRTNRFNNRVGICYKSDAKTEAEIKAEKDKKDKENKAQKDAVEFAKKAFDDFEVKTPEDLQKSIELMKAHLELKAAFEGRELREEFAALQEATEAAKTAKDEEIKGIMEKLAVINAACEMLGKRTSATGTATAPKATQTKTFNEILGETFEQFADKIKNFKKGSPELRMPFVGFEDIVAEQKEVKAVGDMNFAANFAGSTPFTQEVRPLITSPYNRVWLSDLLPAGTGVGSSIIYPKENGGEGAAALWTDRTANKAQIDFDLTSQTAFFKWIAGYVIIDREMLDDVTWLLSYLQNKMLVSLKTAENNFILFGSADTNPVQGLFDAATIYNGSYTKLVDKIVDAGWGQIVEDTFGFYNPTTAIVRPRDAVAIGLNTAAGSGEYDLPAGSVAFAAGQLLVAGMQVATSTDVDAGNFLVFDRMATQFVRRMQPELRMFEDATLAKLNRVMFRIEERATLAIFNNAAIVAGAEESG